MPETRPHHWLLAASDSFTSFSEWFSWNESAWQTSGLLSCPPDPAWLQFGFLCASLGLYDQSLLAFICNVCGSVGTQPPKDDKNMTLQALAASVDFPDGNRHPRVQSLWRHEVWGTVAVELYSYLIRSTGKHVEHEHEYEYEF